jgi:hypothetical protein
MVPAQNNSGKNGARWVSVPDITGGRLPAAYFAASTMLSATRPHLKNMVGVFITQWLRQPQYPMQNKGKHHSINHCKVDAGEPI